MITLSPEDAWRKYISPVLATPNWIDDSSDISANLAISRRELLSLIVLAHIVNSSIDGSDCKLGYDPTASEPNDGLILSNGNRLDIEHKFVPEPWTKQIALDAILSTYSKYAKKGIAYGENRTLIIHANKGTNGLVRVTKLRDHIIAEGSCPFDQVLLLYASRVSTQSVRFHVTEHHPDKGLAAVEIKMVTGEVLSYRSNLSSLPKYF